MSYWSWSISLYKRRFYIVPYSFGLSMAGIRPRFFAESV